MSTAVGTPSRSGGGGESLAARWSVPAAVAVMATLAVGVLLVGLLLGGGGPQSVPVGLPDPGPLVGWGLPVAQLAATVCAAGTVGALLAGVVLLPGTGRSLSGWGYRAVRASGGWATGWAVSSAIVLVLQMSDFLGPPPTQLLDARVLASYALSAPQGRSALLVTFAAMLLAVAARVVVRAAGGTALLLLALAAVLPPAFTGHSASAASHDVATSSLVVHVLAATVWVGGLGGLLLYARRAGAALPSALARFSAVALVSYAAVVGSGIVNAWTRLGSPADLVGTRYGLLVVGKAILALLLGALGWRHRRRTMAWVRAGQPRAFVRLAAVEVLVMGAAFALAVALSRAAPPGRGEPVLSELSPAARLLGYDVPPLTVSRLLTDWRPDAIVLTGAAVALGLYLTGLRRLSRRGITWPWWRAAGFAVGVLAVVVVMCSGVATYAMAMFSVHMGQHMVLTMLAPVLLAIGAPVTLALRALPAAGRGSPRGPREWLLAGLHSRPSRLLTQPVLALAIYLLSLYGLYFTPLFETAMRSHGAHLLMSAHFLAVGILFFFPIIGADPMPRRLPHAGRLLLLGVSLPVHAFFGVIVLGGKQLLAPAWFGALALPGVDLLADQQLGGGIAWAAGEVPTLLVLLAVLPSWSRASEREGRRADRTADRDGDAALNAWNAHLAALAGADQQQVASGPDRRHTGQ